MFSFFLANNLLAPNQSGFKPGDSCLNQLLSITHEIYLKLEVSSWVYLKPLIKFCMKGLYLNLSKMVFRLACLTSYLIFQKIGNKELCLMVSPLPGPMLM